jgi:putative transcriptional regulator
VACAQATAEAALLAATPALAEAPFARSVVLVGRGPDGQTLGLILNQPLRSAPPPALALPGLPVFRGGPVAPADWFGLAEREGDDPAWLSMGGSLRMAAGEAAVTRLFGGSGVGRKRLFRGCSGWAPGQLGDEVRGGYWIARGVDADLVFDDTPATLWERLSGSARAI